MKYNEKNPPLRCFMTQSTCYRGTGKMTVRGVLWHSTGANNPCLKRYVQPDDDAPDRAEMLALLGKNLFRNDWNHVSRQAGLNAWIGKLECGAAAAVQTMPWDYKPWGCGGGSRGSCNDGWIQFEICEDNLKNVAYFEDVYREACELTAYLCKLYGIDPRGTVNFKGVKVPTVLCHRDSYRYGLGCNHSDVYHWFDRYGYDMERVREDVARLMALDPAPVETGKKIPVHYQVYANGRWLPEVRDRQDYAGNLGQSVTGILASADGCDLVYKAGLLGGPWLPEVKNREDYAGIFGRPVDRFMIKSLQGNTVHARAHVKGGAWLPEATGYDEGDDANGYAGLKGRAIDALYIWADPIKEGGNT